MRKALITGITGQDGSYLTELLLEKGYKVHGVRRRSATGNLQNIEHLLGDIELHYAELGYEHHLCSLIGELQPDELYNLASQSDVGVSFDCPEETADVTALAVVRILEAVRHFSPQTRMYQASTSELYGDAPAPQIETTPMIPNSPYAVSKLFAHRMCRLYRDAYGLFISCGILFNHESPRRGLNFVTRKIARAAARREAVSLGNLQAQRDWGYAPDYVRGMYMMLQHERPDDFVMGTGDLHSVEDFVREAYRYVGLDWKEYVQVDPRFYRPVETRCLRADSSKARDELGWAPSVSFKDLVEIMVEAEVRCGQL